MKKQLRFIPAILLSSAVWTMAMDNNEIEEKVQQQVVDMFNFDMKPDEKKEAKNKEAGLDSEKIQWSSNPDHIGKTIYQVKQEQEQNGNE